MQITSLRFIALLITGFLLACQNANAHFIWIITQNGSGKIYFGEGLEPDKAEFLAGLKDLKVYRYEDGKLRPVPFEKKTDGELGWFETANAENHPLFANCDYGVFGRGEKSMRLNYSAKCIDLSASINSTPVQDLPLDLIPQLHGRELTVTAYYQGKSASEVEIILENGVGAPITRMSDKDGRVSFEVKNGIPLKLRGKKVLNESGEVAGKKYDEHRFYCTMVLNSKERTPPPSTIETANANNKQPGSLPNLPVSITSFGGAVLDNHLYVFGGQMGDAHAYADEWQNGTVYSIDLKNENPQWKSLDQGPGYQGLALLAHRGRLLHLGGFQAQNKIGEPHNLVSRNDFRAFNLESMKWESLPSLPKARSSFDACLVGDVVYVVGGWTLKGQETSEWSTDAMRIDLSENDPQWKTIAEPPFKRRALAVVHHADKIFAIGGIDSDGKTSNRVDYFDLKKEEWVQGADLPSTGPLKGFGCCALIHQKQLIVSTADGVFFKHDDSSGKWNPLSPAMDPSRFFHRAFSVSDSDVIVIGGANMEIGKFQEVRKLKLTQ